MCSVPPPSHIRDWLTYDPVSGAFMWAKARGRCRAGGFAGFLQTNNTKTHRYIAVRFEGREYAGHRLAWWFETGVWSDKHIDHRDRDSLDNRWENLREAEIHENQWNKAANSMSTTGLKGVTPRGDKFIARIAVKNKRIYLGAFETPEAAYAAYTEAARTHHGEFSRVA